MLKQLYASLITENPARDYFRAYSRRTFHRLRWFVPVIIIGALSAGYYAATEGLGEESIVLCVWGTYAAGLAYLLLSAFKGLHKMLRPQTVEPLILTLITPQQIWSAVMISLNSSFFVLTLWFLPVLIGSLVFPYQALPEMIFYLWCFVNTMGLLFGGLVLDVGPGNGRTIAIALLLFIGLASAVLYVSRSSYQPVESSFVISRMNPVHVFLRLKYGEQPPRKPSTYGAYGYSQNGRMAPPYNPISPSLAYLAVALGFFFYLMAGPTHFPRISEEWELRKGRPISRSWLIRLFHRLGGIRFSLRRSDQYPWAFVIERLYDSSPRFIHRHSYIYRTVAMAWVLAVVLFLFLDAQWNISHLWFSAVAQVEFLVPFLIYLLLSSLHLSFAGAPDAFASEETTVPMRVRVRAVLLKLALGLMAISYFVHDAENIILDVFLQALAYILVFFATVCAFNWFVSLFSRTARAAVIGALLHIGAWIVGPVLYLLAIRALPYPYFTFAKSTAFIGLLSPVVALGGLVPDNIYFLTDLLRVTDTPDNIAWKVSGCALVIECLMLLYACAAVKRMRKEQQGLQGQQGRQGQEAIAVVSVKNSESNGRL